MIQKAIIQSLAINDAHMDEDAGSLGCGSQQGPRLAPYGTHFDEHGRPIEPPLGECPTVQVVIRVDRLAIS
jgi:hypothetical protein